MVKGDAFFNFYEIGWKLKDNKARTQEKTMAHRLSLVRDTICLDQGKESLHTSQVTHQAGAYPSFCSMKQLRIFLTPLDGMLVHCSIKFACTHLYIIHWYPFVHLGGERHWEIY